MAKVSGYDLETWVMISQRFLILCEFALKRWVTFRFCVYGVSVVQLRKLKTFCGLEW